MKIKPKPFIFILIIFFAIPFLCLSFGTIRHAVQVQILAQKMHVQTNIDLFSNGFPVNYLAKVLTPQIGINEVHQLITGFDRAVKCKPTLDSYSEIYYFFSSSDDSATRFRVLYDYQFRVISYSGEDNSQSFDVTGCTNGVILPAEFPIGYLSSNLRPGMDLLTTHSIIKNYEKVLNCKFDYWSNSEIYYFFSSDDDSATRIQVDYDEQFRFVRFGTEDNNSRSIKTGGCVIGLLYP